MIASGNSQPVARTPGPETVPILENWFAGTGVLMLLLFTEVRTNWRIDPAAVSTKLGTGTGPASANANPLNTKLSIVESFSRTTAAIEVPNSHSWQFSNERLAPEKLILPYKGEGRARAQMRLGGSIQRVPACQGRRMTFLSAMLPK